MNYDSASLTGRAIALVAPVETHRAIRRSERVAEGSPTLALIEASNEALRKGSGENVVWLMLALGSLAALLISFWL
jgi:hypothetical protein